MKFLSIAKDGGPKSTVTGYWLTEVKSLFSAVLLRFADGSRDEYHSHAFNSLNWVLRGRVVEKCIDGEERSYGPSIVPILTTRSRFHRVVSDGTTWVFSLRGPWKRFWREYDPKTKGFSTLTHGRKTV